MLTCAAGQCGGIGYKGPTKCPEGFACMQQSSNAYYSQYVLQFVPGTNDYSWCHRCLPGTLPPNDGRAAPKAPVEQAAYAQCGGLGYKGSTVCTQGVCTLSNLTCLFLLTDQSQTVCQAQAGNIYFSQ